VLLILANLINKRKKGWLITQRKKDGK
jgi:hypothetical protein